MVRKVSVWFKTMIFAALTAISLPLSAAETDDVVNKYISDNPFETMIQLGRMTEVNPIYAMPAGSAGSTYISSAITTGDAVLYPLGYSKTSAPSKHFVIVSKETSLLTRAASFDLVVTENVSPDTHNIAIYTDWNRDGEFEQSSVTPVINSNTNNFTASLQIPADAELGKTRVRVRLDSSAPASPSASVSGGRTYDFVFYVMEEVERTDAFISVAPNNANYGVAMIETAPNANGRYDLNTQVTVKAVLNAEVEDVSFQGWQVNGAIVSTDRIYEFTVTNSMHLIAVFSAPEPVLSTPKASTAEDPIWFQIMNAQTDERASTCIAYNSGSTYTLRLEGSATTDDRFLWRLESAGDNMYYLINKATGTYLYSNGTNDVALGFSSTPAPFAIYAHSGSIYTIAYNNTSGKYLNGGTSSSDWRITLYNAGLGTGSGWYFYEVPEGGSGESVIYPITVSVNDAAMGSATASSFEVEEGANVTLTATPNEGYVFENWTVDGTVVSSSNPCTIRVYDETEYVANFAVPSYCEYEGNMQGGDRSRKLSSFTITDGTNSVTPTAIQTSYTSPVYVDKTASVLTTTAGASLSFSSISWEGGWMHGYVYIDYDKDATFDQVLNADGTTGGEVVSYSFYTTATGDAAANGLNSKGEAKASDSGVVGQMPSWTLPADLAPGEYRLRFKIDWNSLDPCGTTTPGNSTAYNGGCICDITVKIEGEVPEPATYTVTVAASEGGSAIASATGQVEEGTDVTFTATANEGFEFVNWTMNDVEVSTEASITIAIEAAVSLVANFQEVEEPEIEPASGTLDLSFTKESSSSASVTVTGNEVPVGTITSTITSNYSWKSLTADNATFPNASIVCPDKNTKDMYSGYEGTITITLNNVPEGYSFKNVTFTSAAINGQGAFQGDDANAQLVNLTLKQGDNVIGTAENVKIKVDSNGGESVVVPFEVADSYTATEGTVVYTLVIEAANNSGCFYGLVGVSIDTEVGSEPTAIEDEVIDVKSIAAVLNNGKLNLNNLPADCRVSVVSLSGQQLGIFKAVAPQAQFDLKYAERYVIVVLEFANGQPAIIKLSDTRF